MYHLTVSPFQQENIARFERIALFAKNLAIRPETKPR